MTFTALNNALSGIRVAQQQLSVVSQNVSNATTPGYSRKIMPTSAQVIASTGQSVGVSADTIIRRVDINLERELWTQVSGVGELNVKASYLDRIEKFHGATQNETSIAAQIADLKDVFSALSDSPADGFLLQGVLTQAQTVANKFNGFGELVTQLRNDAQDDMELTVRRVNDLLGNIANLNQQIKTNLYSNRSVAELEDKRSIALQELSDNIGISFFKRSDGVMIVQSKTGVQLADDRVQEVYFNPDPLGPSTTYPASAAGVFVGGDPITNTASVDITGTDIGGKLGGLIDLRDNVLMQYQTQVDELAHKLALRLDSQGLRLFTDPTGAVPLDTPPDPSTNPPTAVTYVGFASVMQVNNAIVEDIKLIQQGTYNSDIDIPNASNEVISRVIQYGFGSVSHQEAQGAIDLNVALPATDLQTWLGLGSQNKVVGGINLAGFSQISDGVAGTSDMMEDLQTFFPDYPLNAQFQITFEEPRLGLGPTTITVDLAAASTNFPIGGAVTNALDQITSEINAQITAAALPAGLTATAGRNTNGQLVINSNGNVSYDATFAGSMGVQAFGALGLKEASFTTEDPYIDIQVGGGKIHRVSIEPGEDVNDLIAKLRFNPLANTGIPGLQVDYDAGTGLLNLRPGMDSVNGGPSYGGSLKITSGPGRTSGAVNATLAALPAGVSLGAAIFGSYAVTGSTVSESAPARDVSYGSETFAGSGEFTAFRQSYLGPQAGTGSGILTGADLVDYGQKMINAHGQDIVLNEERIADENTLKDLLQTRLLNESGVNIDEEMSQLIIIQTAYSAAARAVTAADEMFQELLNAVR